MILLFKRFYINEGFMANSFILKNNIKITGNVDVEIKYREPRKVGAY